MLPSSGTSFGHVWLVIYLFLPFLLIFCVYSNPKLLPAVALLWAVAICQCGQYECVSVCVRKSHIAPLFTMDYVMAKAYKWPYVRKCTDGPTTIITIVSFLGAVHSLFIQVGLCKKKKKLKWANRHISPLFQWGASCLLARRENMTTSSHMSTGLEKASQCKVCVCVCVLGYVCSSPVCAPSL